MTSYQFESHGLGFIVEGNRFMSDAARPDFDIIANRIEAELDAMDAAKLARLHCAAITTTDGPEAAVLDDIANRIKVGVTQAWHNPNAAMVSLIAIPAYVANERSAP